MTSVWMFIAWRLPRPIVYWCAVRLMAHATYRRPTTVVDNLSPADCLKAWTE